MLTLSSSSLHHMQLGEMRATRFGYLPAVFSSVVKEWRAHRAARNVESLSDEMLRDIGISRADIDVVVRYGRSHWL